MRLTAKHEYLIQMLADPEDGRTQKQKGKVARYSEATVYNCLKDKEFLAALHTKTTELVAAKRAGIYRNLYRDSGKGDTPAGVAYLKGAGDIQGGVNVQTNVMQNNEADFADRLRDAKAARNERARDLRRVALEDTD